MRTDGEIFARWVTPHGSGPWHYLVTDYTEPGVQKMTACGIEVTPFVGKWERARYEEIASEFTGGDELEGVRPCCKRCLRVQQREWKEDGIFV